MTETTFNTIAGLSLLFLPALIGLIFRLNREVRRLSKESENLRKEITKLNAKSKN